MDDGAEDIVSVLPILTFAFLVTSLCRCIDNTAEHGPSSSWLMPVISVLAISTAAIHVSYIFSGRKNPNPQAIATILVAWTIVPPAYSLSSGRWYFRRKTHGEVFEKFKYSQELASRVWAAFLIILDLLGQRQLEKSLEKRGR